MSKIKMKDILVDKKSVEGDIGLELEVEFPNGVGKFDVKYPWTVKHEGSLRNNGAEFVTRVPIKIKDVKKSLDYLINDLVIPNNGVNLCPRASFHVHFNVMNKSPIQVWNSVFAYWFMENLLFKYCGEEQRSGNLFCLRLVDAQGILDVVSKDMKLILPFSKFAGNTEYRYAGLNLNAIFKFGSIEARGMACILDASYLNTWVCELHNMFEVASKEFSSPEDIFEYYLNTRNNLNVFLKKFFSNSFVEKLTSFKEWEKDIQSQEGLLISIAYLNWSKWQKVCEEEIPKKLEQDKKQKEKTKKRLAQEKENLIQDVITRNGWTRERAEEYANGIYSVEPLTIEDVGEIPPRWMNGIRILNEDGTVKSTIGTANTAPRATNWAVDDPIPPRR